jgi:hypothetical protein
MPWWTARVSTISWVLLGQLVNQEHPLAVGGELVAHLGEHAEQAPVGRLEGGSGQEDVSRPADHVGGVVVDDCLFGGEVTEECARGDVGSSGDLVDGGGGEAALGEQLERGVDECVAGSIRVPLAEGGASGGGHARRLTNLARLWCHS